MKSSKYYPQRTLLLLTLFFFNSIISLAQSPEPLVKVGIEVLRDQNFKALEGKRVGLVTNPTGVDHSFISTVDILYQAKNVNLTALYGPEHGVRGDTDAGAHVDSNTDAVTGLPVYSLYGKTRKPTPAMLQNVDVIVYDIQDIGVRSYTFISTLGLVMEAAAENNKEVIVLDRPNPLGGTKIEGNIVEPGYFSFVSQFPIPYIYGLTVGELAYRITSYNVCYTKLLRIKPCGLSPMKSKGIYGMSKIIVEKFGGVVPDNFKDLESLPAVGHKTASVVMSQAFGVPAFPVDTHIHRLMYRWVV